MDLFTVDQLRRFLGNLVGGGALVDELPSRLAPAAEVNYHAVGELRRHGMVDQAFFEELLEARPKQDARIREIATAWRVRLPERILVPHSSRSSPSATGATQKGEPVGVALPKRRRIVNLPIPRELELREPPAVPASRPLAPTSDPVVAQSDNQYIDNRGANIGQGIYIQGDATLTFGPLPEVLKRR